MAVEISNKATSEELVPQDRTLRGECAGSNSGTEFSSTFSSTSTCSVVDSPCPDVRVPDVIGKVSLVTWVVVDDSDDDGIASFILRAEVGCSNVLQQAVKLFC